MTTRITLAGSVGATVDGRVRELGGAHSRLTLALLALERGRAVHRDVLAEHLWPGELPASWESALRGAVAKVRTFLVEAGFPREEAISSAGGAYRLQLPSGVAVDVEEALDGVIAAEKDAASARHSEAAAVAAGASATLARPLLHGYESTWLEQKRRELAAMRGRALDVLVASRIALGEHDAAIAAAEDAVALRPFHEEAYRLLMQAHDAAGNRAEALEVYERCRAVLSGELGVDPAPETESLYLGLLRRRAPSARAASGLPSALASAASAHLVGRDAQLERLRDAWASARAGERRVVLVSGEPGIGKTSLVARACADAASDGASVLLGRCIPDLGAAYLPFVEALECHVDRPGADAASLGPLGGELARLDPTLPRRIGGLPPPVAAEPETERYRLYEAVAGWLQEAAPVILVVEDLHWAREPTLAMLGHVIRRSPSVPLLVVGTFRDTETGDALAELLGKLPPAPHTDRLQLEGLGPDDVGAVIGEADEGLAREVHGRTEGNPFFVRELLHHLRETGAMQEDADGRWTATSSVGEAGVPLGVRDVIAARVGRLSEPASTALGLAAVVGHEFDVSLLTELSSGPEDDLLDALDEALSAGLLTEVAGGADRYGFVHALVRSVVYASIPGPRRMRTHQRVGRALAARDDARYAADIAHHYCEAAPLGVLPAAAVASRAAGEQARDRLAFREAAEHYERPLRTSRSLEIALDPVVGCDLQLGLGESLVRAGDPGYRDVLLQAASAARDLGDGVRFASAALAMNPYGAPSAGGKTDPESLALLREALDRLPDGHDEMRARLLATLAVELIWDDDDDQRIGTANAAVALARDLGDVVLARALAPVLIAVSGPDALERQADGARELMALGEATGDEDAVGNARLVLADIHFERGGFRDGEAALAAVEDIARGSLNPYLAWGAAVRRAGVAILAADLERAADLSNTAYELGVHGGLPSVHALHAWGLHQLLLADQRGTVAEMADLPGLSDVETGPIAAFVQAESGRLDVARGLLAPFLERGLDALPRTLLWIPRVLLLARATVAIGESAWVPEIYRKLAPYAGRMGWAVVASCGPVDHALGLLAQADGDRALARKHYEDAATLCDRVGAVRWRDRVVQAADNV